MEYNINILNEDQTIDKIFEGFSISRFGDGEIILCNQKPIKFQSIDNDLILLLKELSSYKKNHHKLLICLPPLIFNKYENYSNNCINYWIKFNKTKYNIEFIKKYINYKQIYGSSFITRLSEIKNKNIIIDKFKKYFQNKNIVYMINNDNIIKFQDKLNSFFNNCQRIEYYIIPSKNLWNIKDKLIQDITTKYDKTFLLLCSGGPSATCLAYYFTLLDYQFIDFGHFINLL